MRPISSCGSGRAADEGDYGDDRTGEGGGAGGDYLLEFRQLGGCGGGDGGGGSTRGLAFRPSRDLIWRRSDHAVRQRRAAAAAAAASGDGSTTAASASSADSSLLTSGAGGGAHYCAPCEWWFLERESHDTVAGGLLCRLDNNEHIAVWQQRRSPSGAAHAGTAAAAGTVLYRRAEFEMEGFQKVMDVNLNSLMACAGKFHPLLAASKGTLITISSTAAFHSTKGNPAYNASKAGAVGLTRTLGEAWAKDGIRVNGIAPGLVATKMTKVTTDNPERLQASLAGIPMRRLGTPEDMAGVALFLASPMAAYVLGQTIPVDGGLILA